MTVDHGVRLSLVEKDCEWIKEAVNAIKINTDKMVEFTSQVVRHEERQSSMSSGLDRAFVSIQGVQADLNEIKREMPTIEMARDWFFTFCLWAISVTGGMFFLIIKG